jgi:DNA repair protein RecN (Recombination protein N)
MTVRQNEPAAVMLRTLRIRDLVILDDLSLTFGPGLNLLTGETGAGKSILVDALGLVGGARADRGLVRAGAERAVVEALFDVDPRSEAASALAERGLPVGEEGELLVLREVAAAGSGRVLVGGSPATVALLREIGPTLLELHGQHEQMSLLAADSQLALLDAYGDHASRLGELARARAELAAATERLAALEASAADRDAALARLERTVREIAAADPHPGELERIDLERRRLRHAGRMVELLEEAVSRSYEGEPSAAELAAGAARRAAELGEIDPSLAPIAERLRAAAIELEDAGAALRDYRDRTDFDPARLDALEGRRAALERLMLEHAVDEAGLAERLAESRRALGALGSLDASLAAARAALERAAGEWADVAAELGAARRGAAHRLAQELERQFAALALAHARFEVAFEPARAPALEVAGRGAWPCGARGAERVEFVLAANPGEPLRPLAQVAAGGELSRVMLALHVVAERRDRRRVLVFDEVDAGVGGAVADAIGARLSRLGRGQQVLCVTHLPQVAAYADHHFRIEKRVEGGRTRAAVASLSAEHRVEELARMLAGRESTAASLRHAAEMLEAAARVAAPAPRRRR